MDIFNAYDIRLDSDDSYGYLNAPETSDVLIFEFLSSYFNSPNEFLIESLNSLPTNHFSLVNLSVVVQKTNQLSNKWLGKSSSRSDYLSIESNRILHRLFCSQNNKSLWFIPY